MPTETARPADTAVFRVALLLFVGLLMYGSYFAYDTISAIGPKLIVAWSTDRGGIGLLFTSYSIAAILSVGVGGVLTDRIGTRRASLIFSGLIVIGTVIVALSPSLPVAIFGRFLFGAGSESMAVAQSAILARWFSGRWLALSFGLTLTLSRLGTLFSFNTAALVDARFGWQAALWVAAILCIASLGANVVYFLMDRYGSRNLRLEDAASDKLVLADIKKFRSSYWFIVLLCVTFYSAIFPFTNFSTDFFNQKWGLPLTADAGGSFLGAVFNDFLHMFSTAPGTSSIVIFASMVCAPFAGHLVDRIGRRASLMILGALLMIPAHLLMGYTQIPPRWPMMALGAAFVLVPAAMWPSVPLVVDKQRVGTAFGLMTMIQNIGLALFPLLNGALRDATGDYAASMTMFGALGVAGLVLALLLLRADRREGHVLEQPGHHA